MDPLVQVLIVLDREGRVVFNAGGPRAGDKLAILGMLDIAREAVHRQAAEPAPQKQLLVATAPLPGGK